MLTFSEYTREFLDASARWLADQEIRELTNTPIVTDQQRETFYNSLPSRSNYKIWGITYEKTPIGACGLKHITQYDAEYWGYLGEKELWGLGLGGELLKMCLEYASSLNLESLYLYVTPTNERAKKLYQRFKFTQIESDIEGMDKMMLKL